MDTRYDQLLEAKKTLVKLGAAKWVNDLSLYHGRANLDGTEWKVDPSFDNRNNNSNNANVNHGKSALHTGDFETAKNFANERALDLNGKPEVQKILAKDDDAIVFSDTDFSYSALSEKDKKIFTAAMSVLNSFHITQTVPIKFEYKDLAPYIIHSINQTIKEKLNGNTRTLTSSMINCDEILLVKNKLKTISQYQNILEKLKIPSNEVDKVIEELVSGLNTKVLFSYYPSSLLWKYLLGSKTFQFKDDKNKFNISEEYISAWCANNGVIGLEGLVDSATLGKTIKTYQLFDLKKIETQKSHGERLQKQMNIYGELVNNFIEKPISYQKQINDFLLKANSNELMQVIKKDSLLQKLYETRDGNWENSTIEQHTKAVIDLWDKYYKHFIPSELHGAMKVAMLVHDIGKGIARQNPQLYDNQKYVTLLYADHLYDCFDINKDYRSMLNFIISDSQTYTSNYFLRDTGDDMQALYNNSKEVLKQTLGHPPNQSEINGLIQMCIHLQNSDSGSYTYYAKVQGDDGYYHTGGNERFTNSFILTKDGTPVLTKNKNEKYK